MGRRKKVTTAAAPEQTAATAKLIAALKFVSCAQKDVGEAHETHCVLHNQYAYAFNGVLSAGHAIADPLIACPHTGRFLDALTKCSESINMTQLDNGRLSIASGKFKAMVPCVDIQEMPYIFPDPMVAPIDNRIIDGFKAVEKFSTEGAQSVLLASVLLRNNTVVVTDRHIIIEYWHGNCLPPSLVMPKTAVNAILKAGKPLKGFGCSQDENGEFRSATFHFEDDSWVKTQLYVGESAKWPDTDRILNVPTNAWPLPKGLSEAIKAVSSFSEDGGIYTDIKSLRSHPDPDTGASYEIEGLPQGRSYATTYLEMVASCATKADFGKESQSVLYFFGENLRGAVAARRVRDDDDSGATADPAPDSAPQDDPAGIDYAAVQEASAGIPGAPGVVTSGIPLPPAP